MNTEDELKELRQYAEEDVTEVLQQWIDDFGNSGYSSSYSSREDDRVQLYPSWGDAEVVRNDGDEILDHAYAFCSDLAPNHEIDKNKVKAFVADNIKQCK